MKSEEEEFADLCIEFQQKLSSLADPRYSDRVIISVFTHLIATTCKRQDDPKDSLMQCIQCIVDSFKNSEDEV